MWKRIPLLLTLTAAGCTWMEQPTPETPTLGQYSFTYTIEDRQRVRLIQAFDDQHKTYLQFNDIDRSDPRLTLGPDLPPMSYTRSGPYLIVEGTYPRILVTVKGATVTVTNDRFQPAQPADTQPDLKTQIDNAQRTIDALQQQLADLNAKLELARATQQEAAVFVLRFPNNSAALVTNKDVVAQVTAKAGGARLSLAGYTDAERYSDYAASLALSRVRAVRSALIARGVDPDLISTASYPAGHFVADNSTREGKALNRRVEIRLSAGDEA